ncbi:LLM class flavin-dependent oxidoreductase [Streptomyces sp. NPDC052727]|uniref:LLM class flavin-dependent oxidoreductase n=1 Tax=Streptomyces sp. NPDC052727 TaxID=3154854 RepID=UPI00343239EC
MGLLVTSNRIRPPAVLGKIATTIDAISWGRLIMGLGVGGTVQPPDAGGVTGENPAAAEYAAYGLTLVPPGEGIARMEETIAILRGMWTRDVFDFQGRYYTGPAPPDRGLGQPNAPPGRRARRHPEHPPDRRTAHWTTSPSAAPSWTTTAPPSAVIRGRSPAPCSTSSPTTIRPPTARPSRNSSPQA